MSEDNVECSDCVVRDDALAAFERLLQLIKTDLCEPSDLHFEDSVAAFAGKRDLELHFVAPDRERVFAVEVVAAVKHGLLTGEDFLTVSVHHCVDDLAERNDTVRIEIQLIKCAIVNDRNCKIAHRLTRRGHLSGWMATS